MRIRIFYTTHKKPERNSSSPISRNKSELLSFLSFFLSFFFVAEAMAKNPDNLSFEKVRSAVHFICLKKRTCPEKRCLATTPT
jgi:hypothetical protein